MKKFLSILLVAVLLISAAGCGGGGDTGDGNQAGQNKGDSDKVYTLKLAHQASTTHPNQFAAEEFKKKVEAESDGRLKIEIFTDGTLGQDRDLAEGAQAGTVDMALVTVGPLVSFIPELGALDLPFVFKDFDHGFKFIESDVATSLDSEYEAKNLVNLGFYSQGFRHLTNSQKPVTGVDDIKGMKIRVMQSPIFIDTFNTLGASAVPMAWSEVYTSLQQGTIDGQENPVQVIRSMKVYEVQKYLSLTGHTFSFINFIGSKNSLGKLPADLVDIIKNAATEVMPATMEKVQKDDAADLEKLKELGMEVNEVDDKKAFQDKIKGVYDNFAKENGDTFLNGVLGL